VRAACAWVADSASLVRIDESRIEAVATEVASLPAPLHEPMGVEYAVTFNAVNFGSGWHPYMRKLLGSSGNVTLQRRLADRFESEGPFTAAELIGLTADDCAALFKQHLHPPVDELMGLYAESLNDLGRFLLERFDGSFHALVDDARSAARLVELLQEMPMYRDVASYQGRDVPFLKRAQITASDLGCFSDLDRLTLFADNLVPHVLRLEGVLDLDPGLVARIDAGELLEPGGQAEVELRACAVHAAELMVQSLGGAASARDLDYRLWMLGQEPRFKAVSRPRARSIYY
jgi:hypothetical protein